MTIGSISSIRAGTKSSEVAFSAGVIAALASSLITAPLRWTGLVSLDFEGTLGSIITGDLTARTWVLGFVWQLLNGGIWGLIYSIFFKSFDAADVKTGAAFSVVHWIIAGTFYGALSRIFPLASAVGFYGLAGGGRPGFVVFFASYVLFGSIVGFIYGRYLQKEKIYRSYEEQERWQRSA